MIYVAMMVILSVLGAFIAIDNPELSKIFPDSPAKAVAIILGPILPIMSVNYFLALRGGNILPWQNELMMLASFVLTYFALLLPHAYPLARASIKSAPWWEHWLTGEAMSQPTWAWMLLLIPAAILMAFSFRRY